MTGTGRAWVSGKVMRLPSWSIGEVGQPLTGALLEARKPSTATRPLVVPERARIVSQTWMSVTSDGRPAAIPSGITPLVRARTSTSGAGLTVTPLVRVPSFSTSGPRADILAPMAV